MSWIFALVTLMAWTALGVETQVTLSCSAGSRCSFPDTKVCNYTKDMTYELSKGQDIKGWYEGGLLEPRGEFMKRLEFDNQRCVFILLSPSLVDTGIYSITVRYTENEESRISKMTVNVTVFDPVTSPPSPQHEASTPTDLVISASFSQHPTSNLTVCIMRFPAVLLSLAPFVNVVINLIHLIPCRPSAGSQSIQTKLLLISGLLSLACQVVSIGLGLYCGISVWLGLAIFCTVLLIAGNIVSRLKCLKTDHCGEKLKPVLQISLNILQSSFSLFVVIAFYPTHGEKIGQTIWPFIIFAVIYVVIFTLPYIVHTVYHSYCCPKTTEEADATEMEKMSPSENGLSIQKTDKDLQPAV